MDQFAESVLKVKRRVWVILYTVWRLNEIVQQIPNAELPQTQIDLWLFYKP